MIGGLASAAILARERAGSGCGPGLSKAWTGKETGLNPGDHKSAGHGPASHEAGNKIGTGAAAKQASSDAKPMNSGI
ncbi:MAG TPA: hypothetical protein VGG16_16310 [Streptosporangiaceae bacterium]|jgi:hypothetical protein